MSNKTIKGLSDKIDLFYQTLKNEQNKMQDSITALFNFINSKKQYLAEDLDGIIKSFHNPDEDIKQENIKIMITGTYNSGKSSLLNALLGKEERSTGNIPTTSDIEMIKWKDLIFYDTPGIDAIEHSVLEDVFKLAQECQLILYVLSASQGNLDSNQTEYIKQLTDICPSIFFVINKIDLRSD